MENKCNECSKTITGRSDKKFCDSICRNTHYNNLHSTDINNVRTITRSLLKNRRILQRFVQSDAKKISRDKLTEDGFTFKYYTNMSPAKKGSYVFCYDYGYLPLENDWYLLVKNKDLN